MNTTENRFTDQIAGQLHRFRTDFPFYAPRCLKIRAKTGSLIPFHLNTAQRYIHKRIEEQKERFGWVRAIILKGRQQGCSTYVEARFFHAVSGERGKYAYILTHMDTATKNLFAMVDRFYRNCPSIVRPHKGPGMGYALNFNHLDSGYDVGTARTAGTGRSGTYQYFHGSEVAYWRDAEGHMAGVGQAVPLLPGTEILLESTASDVGNLFHEKWLNALAGVGEYIPIFIPWFWQKEYRMEVSPKFELDPEEAEYADVYGCDIEQMAWRRHKIQTDFAEDITQWMREYPATPEEAFMAGMEGSFITPIEVAQTMNPEYTPEPSGAKIMGVDVAEYGDDATVITRREGRIVHPLEVHYKKGTMETAGRCTQIIEEWDPDSVNVDVTGVGTGVADRLIEMGYEQVVKRVHNGGKATMEDLYNRKRDEQWGEMRDWIRELPCVLPNDQKLAAELCSPKYSYDSSRRLRIESKEHMRDQRGIKSPDRADSLALTFAYSIQPRRKRTTNISTYSNGRKRANWQTA